LDSEIRRNDFQVQSRFLKWFNPAIK
jgi:hypothetical protein